MRLIVILYRNINDGHSSQYLFDTPSTSAKGGDSYKSGSDASSLLRKDERSWKERNVGLFKPINEEPLARAWNGSGIGVSILPHLKTIEKRIDRRGEVAELPDIAKK